MTISSQSRVVALNPYPGVDFVFENEALEPIGARVEPLEVPDDVSAAIADVDVLIPLRYRASRDLIAGLQRCRLIASIGIGVDHIDVAAATDHGILVTNMGDL